jgi:hypothetical protein
MPHYLIKIDIVLPLYDTVLNSAAALRAVLKSLAALRYFTLLNYVMPRCFNSSHIILPQDPMRCD